ncbi:MAG: AMP-binding protein [Eubacteriales bacterium]
MKLAFSTKHVKAAAFLEWCNTAAEYGFAGFEIHDPQAERAAHSDSLLHPRQTADARRKLYNRNLEVPALNYPTPLDETTDPKELERAVDFAINAGVPFVIVSILRQPDTEGIRAVLTPAIRLAEKFGVSILLESAGYLAHTERVIDLINLFATGALAAAWNIRETYFAAGEDAETTIRTLGAYINYVRIGDRLDGVDVLLGEGSLPVGDFMNALHSLNYDGYFCADWNDEIADPDIVLTHFKNYVVQNGRQPHPTPLYRNRAGTGTFVWEKYKVIDQTFPQVLDTVTEQYPDQYVFKYPTLDYTRTYAEFSRDVDEAAAALISLGVKPGHHVAIWATNVPQWFVTFWAAIKIGAVLVTVNTAYKIHEAEYLFRQSDTHTLVMIESFKDSNYKEIIQQLCPELQTLQPGKPLYAKKLPFLRNIITVGFQMPGCLTWEQMLERAPAVPQEEVRRRAAALRADDICNMQYTSGTTGFPKGVMLSHSNIINNGKTIGDRMDMSTVDRMLVQVPMFHCFGMVLTMTSIMTHGGTLCPLPYFSPKASLAAVTDEKITCLNGVPTMFIAMFHHEDFAQTDFSHMRTGIMAGANCPADLMRRAAAEMHMTEILSVYGQTESSPGLTMGEVDEDLDLRCETVGSAFPGVSCKVIDPATGEELPDGQSGEMVARGFNIMKGYYKMPAATAQTIDADGWLHTGDICCRTPNGYYKVTGRLKDMIIRGGENLYPREIEEFYLTHPDISDVQVVGVPDKVYGEEACAWIILRAGRIATEQQMREFGQKHIARHKIPRYFLFVEEFPMNAAGKIQKYKMRERSLEILGLKD